MAIINYDDLKGNRLMEIKIPQVDKNIYEKYNSDNWMCLPRYTSDDDTSHLDVGDLVYCPSEFSDYEEDVDIREIFSHAL